MGKSLKNLLLGLLVATFLFRHCAPTTSPGDVAVLQDFLKGIRNSQALSSWVGGDPCGDRWEHIKCVGQAISGLDMGNLGLGGSVTPKMNQLKSLATLQLQGNGFTGSLPSLAGLGSLINAYFGGNLFDTIPGDFFTGLTSLTEIFLDDNRVNSTGWSLPPDVASCSSLQKLSVTNTSMSGTIPDFLGTMENLKQLNMAYNSLGGLLPGTFSKSNLNVLKLNNQLGNQPLSGPIDPVVSMQSLTTLWLHVNQFNGTIPEGIGNLPSLEDLRLNDNRLVGLIPVSLEQLSALKNVTVKGNRLVGPVVKLAVDYDFEGNGFCQQTPGASCDPQVTVLLEFLQSAQGFSSPCTSNWEGNDPCGGSGWQGISCVKGTVTSIGLPNCQLTGTLSASLANLTGLTVVNLKNNALHGTIPQALVDVPTLRTLTLNNNNLFGPVPSRSGLQIDVSGNPLGSSPGPSSPDGVQAPDSTGTFSGDGKTKKKNVTGIAVSVAVVILVVMLGGACVVMKRRRKGFMKVQSSSGLIVHPRNSTELAPLHSGPSELRVETPSLVTSVHVLRKATNNFNEQSILGRGGFGVVYKGELDDGTLVAVKRMEVAVTGLSEFMAEIEVLTKVRHRNLVALLGYCMEDNEKLLVYEYMSQGTLSQHLFAKGRSNFQPLSWAQRLSIALDVARGLEYLHALASLSFIHRDLKPTNILLDDKLHAKISDFGLVKCSPVGINSVQTRVAGTFGYLAPEYAFTGRASPKVDIYSYGVILMELITGLQALDQDRPEESVHLASWFKRVITHKEFKGHLDPNIECSSEEEFESISKVVELAEQCTRHDPVRRPDMSYVVRVLASMVERWTPSVATEPDSQHSDIDFNLSLPEALQRWQDLDSMDRTMTTSSTISSIPARPPGFDDVNTSVAR